MEPIYLALLFIAIIAIGEVISIKSRARIPTLLVVVATVFILLQTGILPESYIAASTFVAVGGVLVPVLIVHLGTMIPLKTMYKQYQAVLITLIGLTFSVLGVMVIVTLLFNYETAVAGAGPITGGIIAYIVTADGLREAGFTAIIAIPIAVFTIQNFIGMR
ncbi:integral membrane protein [Bacillus sp. JCM 19045]|nr:integral membrane protein [Bacillus sp. JCM 19045]